MVSSFDAGVKFQVPSKLSVSVPLLAVRLLTVSVSLSSSLALPSNSAAVMTRTPLSSAIAVNVTSLVVGASLTGVISKDALPVVIVEPSPSLML